MRLVMSAKRPPGWCATADARRIHAYLDQGDASAFESYFEDHKARVFRWALRLGALWQDGWDIVQRTFIHFERKIRLPEKAGFRSNPDALLFRIARFRTLDWLRSEKAYSFHVVSVATEPDEDDLDAQEGGPDTQGDDGAPATADARVDSRVPLLRVIAPDVWAQFAEVQAIVSRLPHNQQVVFTAILLGASHDEVAAELGCPVATARSLRYRLLVKLESILTRSPLPGISDGGAEE